jgi:hypothetical protein
MKIRSLRATLWGATSTRVTLRWKRITDLVKFELFAASWISLNHRMPPPPLPPLTHPPTPTHPHPHTHSPPTHAHTHARAHTHTHTHTHTSPPPPHCHHHRHNHHYYLHLNTLDSTPCTSQPTPTPPPPPPLPPTCNHSTAPHTSSTIMALTHCITVLSGLNSLCVVVGVYQVQSILPRCYRTRRPRLVTGSKVPLRYWLRTAAQGVRSPQAPLLLIIRSHTCTQRYKVYYVCID